MDFPTERLTITLPDIAEEARRDYANTAIDAFAAELVARDVRPWFEVWYIDPADSSRNTTEANFDALELTSDGIVTLPPYPEGWTR